MPAREWRPLIAGTGADDDPPSRPRPVQPSSRSEAQPIRYRVARSATALRARPRTDVHFAWSPAARNPASLESGVHRGRFTR